MYICIIVLVNSSLCDLRDTAVNGNNCKSEKVNVNRSKGQEIEEMYFQCVRVNRNDYQIIKTLINGTREHRKLINHF
jgi:hypothetical protein